jgi:hypothetical protein
MQKKTAQMLQVNVLSNNSGDVQSFWILGELGTCSTVLVMVVSYQLSRIELTKMLASPDNRQASGKNEKETNLD